MDKWAIEFPNLGIHLDFVPKSFMLFGKFSVAMYAIIIMTGMFAGLFLAVRIAKKTNQQAELYWDFFLYAVIVSIIGARIYYVAFEWDSYRGNFLKMINIREGGMAIYGAVIGAFLCLFVYCKIKKISPLLVGDTAVPGLILGQIIGRWGNFCNREAFGEYTNNLFAMRLPTSMVRNCDITPLMMEHMTDNTIQVHPTFLYESVANLIVLTLMLVFMKKKKFNGEVCLWYFCGYGVVRFFVEALRTDQLQIGNSGIAVSQMLSVVLVIAAVVTDVCVRSKKKVEKTVEE